ncbi:nucleotide exchange factor GrpE [Fluviispira sanaruensis]|uniref:Protein GrpE n=2 Tax=Fluviispira sanaruensis TaxID=2493639 RepID=A0A4P2VZY7_FLUSA|nr:nucleotide exchange factor GrpE [Fluviispira sanaruensis]
MFLKNIIQMSSDEAMGETNSPEINDKSSNSDSQNPEVQGASTAQNEEAARISSLEAECAAVQAKLSETHDRMLRIAADAENMRKRMEREKADTRLYSIQEFAKDLLPVIDAFDKAMSAIELTQINFETEEGKKVAGIVEGVQLVSKVFQDAVKKHGIERLPGKDAPFNPTYHNAIAKIVDASFKQETVIDEFMAGYKIGERILRTAMVRVGAPD